MVAGKSPMSDEPAAPRSGPGRSRRRPPRHRPRFGARAWTSRRAAENHREHRRRGQRPDPPCKRHRCLEPAGAPRAIRSSSVEPPPGPARHLGRRARSRRAHGPSLPRSAFDNAVVEDELPRALDFWRELALHVARPAGWRRRSPLRRSLSGGRRSCSAGHGRSASTARISPIQCSWSMGWPIGASGTIA